MKQRIIVPNFQSVIYIYEEDCGYVPHTPFEEFESLKEARKEYPSLSVCRYPSKNPKYEF